jgi:multiple sugar transport system substrate-binding protein
MSPSSGRLPSSLDSSPLSRRSLLKGLVAGAAGVAAAPVLAACSSSTSGSGGTSSSGAAAGKTVTLGSNASDAVPKKAYQEVYDAFTKKTGIKVSVNTVDHNSFQEQINTYLQGNPQDVFTWFAGYRMQFFAKQGLATPIPEVWSKAASNYSDALKQASTGEDGKQYFVPFYYYPWALFYRKSVFADGGYQVPTTYADFVALCKKMQSDGLTPIAFADKDGWPAMGTFDIINLRTNGYDFHVSLLAGKEKWTDPKVKKVFETWRELLPYHQQGSLGRTWQEAAQTLQQKKAGMYLLGMFVGQQFQGDKASYDDLDFFPYPEIDPQWGQDSIDAPIDGFMMSAKVKEKDASTQLLQYLATGEAQNIYLKSDPNNIAAGKDADTSGYNALQKKAVEVIGKAKHITQFLDRDTRPDFASTVMIPSLQTFINKPDDIDGLLSSIEQQKQSIFGS